MSEDALRASMLSERVFHGTLLGVFVALFVYNLFVLVLLRTRTYFYYVAYLPLSDYGSHRVEHGTDYRSLSWPIERRNRVPRFERSPHALHPAAVSLDRSETARSRFHVCDGLSASHAAAPAGETENRL